MCHSDIRIYLASRVTNKSDRLVTKEALCRADPDMQISRIRLSDKASYHHPQLVAGSHLESYQAQLLV
jgi:hypothetical protein